MAAFDRWTGRRVGELGLIKPRKLEEWGIWLVLMYTTSGRQLLLQRGVLRP